MKFDAEWIAADEWNEWLEADANFYEEIGRSIGIDTKSRRLSHVEQVAIELAYRLGSAADLAASGGHVATPQEMAELPRQVSQGLKALLPQQQQIRAANARRSRSASTPARKGEKRAKIQQIVEGYRDRGKKPLGSPDEMSRLRNSVRKQLEVALPLSGEIRGMLTQSIAECWPSDGEIKE